MSNCINEAKSATPGSLRPAGTGLSGVVGITRNGIFGYENQYEIPLITGRSIKMHV